MADIKSDFELWKNLQNDLKSVSDREALQLILEVLEKANNEFVLRKSLEQISRYSVGKLSPEFRQRIGALESKFDQNAFLNTCWNNFCDRFQIESQPVSVMKAVELVEEKKTQNLTFKIDSSENKDSLPNLTLDSKKGIKYFHDVLVAYLTHEQDYDLKLSQYFLKKINWKDPRNQYHFWYRGDSKFFDDLFISASDFIDDLSLKSKAQDVQKMMTLMKIAELTKWPIGNTWALRLASDTRRGDAADYDSSLSALIAKCGAKITIPVAKMHCGMMVHANNCVAKLDTEEIKKFLDDVTKFPEVTTENTAFCNHVLSFADKELVAEALKTLIIAGGANANPLKKAPYHQAILKFKQQLAENKKLFVQVLVRCEKEKKFVDPEIKRTMGGMELVKYLFQKHSR